MSETSSRPVEIAWAAVAWTQFLIAVTVIDRRDMILIGAFFRMLTPEGPGAFHFDSRPFGSVALALNVISLALFSLPMSALHTPDDLDFDRHRYMRRARHVAVAAHVVWGFSFLALLCYFNPALAGLAFVFSFIAGRYIGPVTRYKKAQPD